MTTETQANPAPRGRKPKAAKANGADLPLDLLPDDEPAADGTSESEKPADDVFALAAKARKDGRGVAKPQITRRPPAIRAVEKTKAWFKTHPEGTFENVYIFQDPTSEDIEVPAFYVTDEVAEEMAGIEGLSLRTGYLIGTANGSIQLFLVKEADDDGKMHQATEDKHEACILGRNDWVRLAWDKDSRAYEIATATWNRRDPKWPADVDMASVFRSAFKKHVIDSVEHPLFRQLMGED